MTQAIFVNLLNTQLAAAASTTSTTLTLSSSANLPTLESGQFFPLWLQDAATGQVHELVYVTGVSGATLTVERAQEGTTAQNWSIGDLAYSNGSSGTFAPITAVHSPVISETLPTANKMVVLPGTLTADIALTLPASPVVGQEYTIFGSNAAYTVTVQTSVGSGSPYIGLPDGSTVYSWVIPASASFSGIKCVWDGVNWRGRTFGPTVVSDATASNEAVSLGQLESLGIVSNNSVSYSGSTTLTSANQGQLILYTGSADGTFTLPSSNSLPAFQCKMVISNVSDYQLSISPPSGDAIDISDFALQPSQSCCLANDGNSTWYTLWNDSGVTSPFVVGDATNVNEAVAMEQLLIVNRKEVFTSNGTYIVPSFVTTIWVSGTGGGGGGGGGNSLSSSVQGAGGGGGFAGQTVIKTPISVTPGDSLTITIGAGGAGGAGTSSLADAGSGSAGGTTSIVSGSTTLLSLVGGAGGNGATVYNTNYALGGSGFSSGMCMVAASASSTVAGTVAVGGNGARTPFSLGGGSGGASGTNGSGGGGGGNGGDGGAGGNGIIIIEW